MTPHLAIGHPFVLVDPSFAIKVIGGMVIALGIRLAAGWLVRSIARRIKIRRIRGAVPVSRYRRHHRLSRKERRALGIAAVAVALLGMASGGAHGLGSSPNGRGGPVGSCRSDHLLRQGSGGLPLR